MTRLFSQTQLFVTTCVAALAMGAGPAGAQTEPQPGSAASAPAHPEPRTPQEPQRNAEALPPDPVSGTVAQIVVTGSFIQSSAENTALPIDVIGGEELVDRGAEIAVGADSTWTLHYELAELRLRDLILAPGFHAVGKLNFQTFAYPLPEQKGMAFLDIETGMHNLRLSGAIPIATWINASIYFHLRQTSAPLASHL